MKNLVSMLVGAAAIVGASSAMAADIVVPVVVAPPVAAPPAPTGFDWSRPYVGVSIGSWRENDFAEHDGIISRAMVQAGFNFEVGTRFLVGAEAQIGVNDFLGGGAELEYAVLGRGGILLGNRALAYAAVGISNGPNNDLGALLGGGVELAIGSRMSIRMETMIYHDFGDTPFVDHILIGGGVNFFFGG